MPEEKFTEYCDLMNNFEFGNALTIIWDIIRKTNTYIDYKAPWKHTRKINLNLLQLYYILTDCIYKINILIQPFLPITSKKIFNQPNVELHDFTLLKMK